MDTSDAFVTVASSATVNVDQRPVVGRERDVTHRADLDTGDPDVVSGVHASRVGEHRLVLLAPPKVMLPTRMISSPVARDVTMMKIEVVRRPLRLRIEQTHRSLTPVPRTIGADQQRSEGIDGVGRRAPRGARAAR